MGFGDNKTGFSTEGIPDLGVGGGVRKIHLLNIKPKHPKTHHQKSQILKEGVLLMKLEHLPSLLNTPRSSEGDGGMCQSVPAGVLRPTDGQHTSQMGEVFTSLEP